MKSHSSIYLNYFFYSDSKFSKAKIIFFVEVICKKIRVKSERFLRHLMIIRKFDDFRAEFVQSVNWLHAGWVSVVFLLVG